jgi:hypothetical protein
MESCLVAAEAALRRSAAPALRLGELLCHVRSETRDLSLNRERLLRGLRAHPDLFRILDPWRGPWRFIREHDAWSSRTDLDPWVLTVSDPAVGDGAGRPAVRRMRSCVRWLATGIDARSPRALARWSRLALAADEARRTLDEAA